MKKAVWGEILGGKRRTFSGSLESKDFGKGISSWFWGNFLELFTLTHLCFSFFFYPSFSLVIGWLLGYGGDVGLFSFCIYLFEYGSLPLWVFVLNFSAAPLAGVLGSQNERRSYLRPGSLCLLHYGYIISCFVPTSISGISIHMLVYGSHFRIFFELLVWCSDLCLRGEDDEPLHGRKCPAITCDVHAVRFDREVSTLQVTPMKSNSPCAQTFEVWRICAQGQQPHWLRTHPEPNFEPGAMQHMIQKRVIDSLFHLADWVFFPGSPTPAPTCPKCSKCWSLPLSFLQQHALARYP